MNRTESSAAPLSSPSASNASSTSKGGKYLTFALGAEEYGLQILKVREIIGWMEMTAVPRTPAFVNGVINLRGQVIPVIDLRAKFAMPAIPRTEQTCIIVAEMEQAGRRIQTGLIVDRVSEVLNIPAESIEEAPTFDPSVRSDFILGLGKIGRGVKILLDIDRVLSTADVIVLDGLPKAKSAA